MANINQWDHIFGSVYTKYIPENKLWHAAVLVLVIIITAPNNETGLIRVLKNAYKSSTLFNRKKN